MLVGEVFPGVYERVFADTLLGFEPETVVTATIRCAAVH
jgi:hypothetical protein